LSLSPLRGVRPEEQAKPRYGGVESCRADRRGDSRASRGLRCARRFSKLAGRERKLERWRLNSGHNCGDLTLTASPKQGRRRAAGHSFGMGFPNSGSAWRHQFHALQTRLITSAVPNRGAPLSATQPAALRITISIALLPTSSPRKRLRRNAIFDSATTGWLGSVLGRRTAIGSTPKLRCS